MISACSVYVFSGDAPIYYPKVFALPVLLGNSTMFVCECSFTARLTSGCVYDVFHASLTSDFLIRGFLSSGLCYFPACSLNMFIV